MGSSTTDSVLLAFAGIVFALYLFWKLRPAFGGDDALELRRRGDTTLAAALAALPSDGQRVTMLCEEAERLATTLGRKRRAAILFARAMRLAPTDATVVDRAVKALAKQPKLLEALLWKRLALAPMTAANQRTFEAAITGLAQAYSMMPRRGMRQRAAHHLAAVCKQLREAPEPRPGKDGR